MAYDAQKAHEYYINYTKKGRLKGRKKGKKKTTTSSSSKKKTLVGLSTAGLSDVGKMQWALIKEDLTSQMQSEMSEAKTDLERQQIRMSYQNKALMELQKLKSDPQYQKSKAVKSGSKKSSGKSESSTKSSSKSSKSSGSSKSSRSSKGSTSKSSAAQTKALKQLNDTIAQLQSTLSSLSTEKKRIVQQTVNEVLQKLKEQVSI